MTKKSSDYILDISRDYSLYVCSSRAIPSIADGLKDAQRKAMWLLRNKKEKIKTISLSGEMISSNLYLHGDASASGAISFLAAPYINNVPLIEGIGTFGTRVAPTEVAAPRYTYVKHSKTADKFFYTDLDIVPLQDNYDGSTKEPVHFLPLIPAVLLNGISGIAVGWSTEILPRKFTDLVNATISVLDGKKLSKLHPDFSYLNVDVVHLEGNTWEFSGKATVVDSSTILITELPPDMNLEKLKTKLDKMEELDEINSYTDRSTDKIEVEIKMKRGLIKDWSDARAIDFLKLRSKKSERIVVLDWNNKSIKQYNTAEDVVYAFVEWRLGWYVKRYQKLLADDQDELLFWALTKECFDKGLPKKLGNIKDRKEIEALILKFAGKLAVVEKHIDRVVNLPTYRWAQDYYTVILDKIKELEDNINLYTQILSDSSLIKAIYKSELTELKKLKI